jgi:hypothetical protein
MSDAAQIPNDVPLTVTLTAAQWNVVLDKLSEPLRLYGPLVDGIQRQCMQQAQASAEQIRSRGNGVGTEMRDEH